MDHTEANEPIEAQQPSSEATATSASAPIEKRRYPWLAVLSLVLCVGAWVAATVSGYLTLAVGAAAIVAGAFSLGSHRPAVRNTAITSIIAAAVLIVVVGAFMVALHKLLA